MSVRERMNNKVIAIYYTRWLHQPVIQVIHINSYRIEVEIRIHKSQAWETQNIGLPGILQVYHPSIHSIDKFLISGTNNVYQRPIEL